MSLLSEYSEEDRKFSCSLYPKLHQSPDNVIQNFISHQLQCMSELLATYEHELDVPYGDQSTANDRQQFDVWFPKNGEKFRKIHIFIHGGYWQEGSRKSSASVPPTFLVHGYTVITLGYTLASEIPLEEVVDLVRRGVKDIIHNHPTAEFSISGHSAGGHLAAKVLEVEELRINMNAGLLIAPIFDIRPLVETYIGRGIRLTEETAEKCSVKLKELAKFEGTLAIINAKHDAPGLLEQAAEIHNELLKIGKVDVIKEEFDEDHFSILGVLSNTTSTVSEWVQAFVQS
ncbi:unnamed protein product [Bursaphelenchus xylophilus]|uniref:(pine wood nematode) hypothetical protein n=1 Tax=Bursaphelenchus xylophilus TaxID=6326 RepID=A0A1I7RT43_BURXY|nr:unnamed protein product [Bursaphelenchus xylophilus]CAG9122624.1 unnamed protein product [Bursaphelenchus xylophilus]